MKLRKKIIKRYQDYGAKIKDCLYYDNGTFKFELKLLEKTQIVDLKKYQKEVQIYAKLQSFKIIEEETAIICDQTCDLLPFNTNSRLK